MKTSDVVWMLNSFDLKLNTILAHIDKEPERAKARIYDLKQEIFTVMKKETPSINPILPRGHTPHKAVV